VVWSPVAEVEQIIVSAKTSKTLRSVSRESNRWAFIFGPCNGQVIFFLFGSSQGA
jgi:hypothetical protein